MCSKHSCVAKQRSKINRQRPGTSNLNLKSKSSAIRSRWNVSFKEMSRTQLIHLLKNNRDVVKNKADAYYKTHLWLSYNEVYSVAYEGFYRAIRAYDPDKGDLVTYAECYCWGWLGTYFNSRSVKRDKREVRIVHDNFEKANTISREDALFLKQLKEYLTTYEMDLLERHCYGFKIKDSIEHLGITRPTYKRHLKNALDKAREFAQ